MTGPYSPHFTPNYQEVEKVGDLSALLLPSWSNYTFPAPAPFLEITTIETATAFLQESDLTGACITGHLELSLNKCFWFVEYDSGILEAAQCDNKAGIQFMLCYLLWLDNTLANRSKTLATSPPPPPQPGKKISDNLSAEES
ncbi:hypothetical protein PG997_000634 [Apiospora hydei]|uniref:Uncharacterized protein n=1 Tax=Apiospora hydei TaxID=1337664 RepID=A0ABR1XBI0_9PEZI